MQTIVLISEEIAMKHTEPIPERDRCDLDPNKVCDNCCKCIETDEEYRTLPVGLDPESTLVFHPGEEEKLSAESMPAFDIDPALLAEWEEKLRRAEEAEKAGEGNGPDFIEEYAGESVGFYGVRKKRPHVPRGRMRD